MNQGSIPGYQWLLPALGAGFTGADGCDIGRWGARVPLQSEGWAPTGAAQYCGTDVFPALVTSLGFCN